MRKISPVWYHKDTYEREKEAKNKLCASRAWHDWADWSRPDLTQTALLSEIRAKMMCWKAGDPWAFLNHQVPLSQHTRRHPRQTGGSSEIRSHWPLSLSDTSVWWFPTLTWKQITVSITSFGLPYLPYILGQPGMSKWRRLCSNPTEPSIWSGSTLFATHSVVLFSNFRTSVMKM